MTVRIVRYLAVALALVACQTKEPLVFASAEGETTFDLFVRLQTEFPPTDDGRTVVVEHPIAHEGLHEKGERALLSYMENMPRIVDTLEQRGYKVVVVLNRPAPDFNSVDMADMEAANESLKAIAAYKL